MQNGENLASTKRGRRFHTKPLPASRADLPLLKWQPRTKLKGKQVKQRNMIQFAKIHPTIRKSKRPSAAKRIFAQEYEASASYYKLLYILNSWIGLTEGLPALRSPVLPRISAASAQQPVTRPHQIRVSIDVVFEIQFPSDFFWFR